MSSSAYNYALKYLVRREHSVAELKQKLTTKGFLIDEIIEAIDLLIQQKYQSDNRFAQSLVITRSNQGKGNLLIIAELNKHKIQNPEKYICDIDFFALCKKVKIKKFGNNKFQNLKEKQKQMRFLQGRGFSFAEINSVFNNK